MGDVPKTYLQTSVSINKCSSDREHKGVGVLFGSIFGSLDSIHQITSCKLCRISMSMMKHQRKPD